MSRATSRSLPVRVIARGATYAFNKILFRPTEWLVRRYSRVGVTPFFSAGDFAWTRQLEDNWTLIRDELQEVLKGRERIPSFHEVSEEQLRITRDDKWKTYMFSLYGRRIDENCKACPETTRLIESIPGMKTAFFSVLGPRKHIPEHRGPYAGVLRYHLGLVVPDDSKSCRIRVGDDIAHWEAGSSMVFDDTYPHEVWNDTDEERVVLFLDVSRPLPALVAALNALTISVFSRGSYVQEVVEKVAEQQRKVKAGTEAAVRAKVA